VEKTKVMKSLKICTPHQILCRWWNWEEWGRQGV